MFLVSEPNNEFPQAYTDINLSRSVFLERFSEKYFGNETKGVIWNSEFILRFVFVG